MDREKNNEINTCNTIAEALLTEANCDAAYDAERMRVDVERKDSCCEIETLFHWFWEIQ